MGKDMQEELQTEALNTQQRMKLKQAMRRNKAKIMMGRKRSMRKLASKEVLQKRAEKAARNVMVKKILKDKNQIILICIKNKSKEY